MFDVPKTEENILYLLRCLFFYYSYTGRLIGLGVYFIFNDIIELRYIIGVIDLGLDSIKIYNEKIRNPSIYSFINILL